MSTIHMVHHDTTGEDELPDDSEVLHERRIHVSKDFENEIGVGVFPDALGHEVGSGKVRVLT